MTVTLIFLTCNRLEYTKKSLPALLADKNEEFNLYIWDNNSKDGTQEYLKSIKDPRIKEIVLSDHNAGQTQPTNLIWSSSQDDLLGKVDNDCVMPAGWTKKLGSAHEDIERLGTVACWHYYPDDFDYELSKEKIEDFGSHKILRHPWTGGTGFLIKNDTYKKIGCLKRKAFTRYFLKMAKKGYVNGFYFPLIYQEHMDDPRSEYSLLRDNKSIEKYLPATAHNFGVDSVEKWLEFLQRDAERLQKASYDPSDYVGLKADTKRLCRKVMGKLKA